MAGEIVVPEPAPEVTFAGDRSAASGRMPRTPFWAPDAAAHVQVVKPGPWQRVTLAGVELPGFCAVRSSKTRKVLTVAGPKADAEELVDTGGEAGDVSIVCYLWTAEHLAIYEDLLDALALQGGTRADPQPVDVLHPGLNVVGIDSIYVALHTVPEPSSLPGVYEFTIQASEFKPKQNRPKTKETVKPLSASKASLNLAPEIQRAASPVDTEAAP
jgi:hypothetical protein